MQHLERAVQKDLLESLPRGERMKPFEASRFPVFQALLETRKKAVDLQESMLKESIQSIIHTTTSIKQKALLAVEDWLTNFTSDKEKLYELKPAGAKTLLAIAYTADQMGRLDTGKSTSNVAIAHQHTTNKPMLQSAIDKLKEIDPVFNYEGMDIKEVALELPKLDDEDDSGRVPTEGASSEEGAFEDGVQCDGGGPRHSDGGPLPSDQ